MITEVKVARDVHDTPTTIDRYPTIKRLNAMLELIAKAYSDDPGTSDLDDEQPAYPVTGLNLGDVRLARSLRGERMTTR